MPRKIHNPKPAGDGPDKVIACLALLIQPSLLGLRAGELSHSLALTDVANRPFISTLVLGMPLEIGTCAVMGVTLTLTQMIAASLYIMDSPVNLRHRVLKALAGSGWIVATALELALSVICANGLTQRTIGFSVALLLTLFETCAGILVIDTLVIPGSLGIAATLRRAFHRRLRRRH